MNLKRGSLLVMMLATMLLPTMAQENPTPKGKAIINVFANFHTGFGAYNNTRGFQMDRSYFGYQYDMGNGLSFKAVVDAGKSNDVDDLNRIVFIKNAQVGWKKGRWTLYGGLISTTLFKVQEDFWGYRYNKMVFADYYKFGSSADLGLSVAYKVNDWLSADLIILNGEGYKKIQIDDGLQYGLGITAKPVEGLTLRAYTSLTEASQEEQKDVYHVALFAGYKNQKFYIAGEYNLMQNSSYKDDADKAGVSFYTTVQLHERVKAFARYDDLWSKDDWNIAKDERTYMAGVEYMPCKYVKIAPHIRHVDYKGEGIKDKPMFYISCFFGF